MLKVVGLLLFAAALGFVDAGAHGRSNHIGVHQHLAVGIARRPADCLNQAGFAAEEAFLVRIQNRNQANFRNVQALAQKVDAHQHVKSPGAEIADDFHTLDGADVVVHVTGFNAGRRQVFGQILGHFFRQCRDESPLPHVNFCVDFGDQIIDLPFNRPDENFGIQQSGRADDLLGKLTCPFTLVLAGRGRNINALVNPLRKLFKLQGSVVIGGRQAETKLHQRILSGMVAPVHSPHLRERHMALIHEEQEILREVIQKGHGRAAGSAV